MGDRKFMLRLRLVPLFLILPMLRAVVDAPNPLLHEAVLFSLALSFLSFQRTRLGAPKYTTGLHPTSITPGSFKQLQKLRSYPLLSTVALRTDKVPSNTISPN
ncbi:hypothetical protein J1614_011265 [Plenodomus biglobosus]|nr:hypothetical protein J1614_011265 [Plenodomus biglobosus]